MKKVTEIVLYAIAGLMTATIIVCLAAAYVPQPVCDGKPPIYGTDC